MARLNASVTRSEMPRGPRQKLLKANAVPGPSNAITEKMSSDIPSISNVAAGGERLRELQGCVGTMLEEVSRDR